ncbi:hypothetical protein ACLKA6_000907, partial [Drosophila palustris]
AYGMRLRRVAGSDELTRNPAWCPRCELCVCLVAATCECHIRAFCSKLSMSVCLTVRVNERISETIFHRPT